VPYLIGGGGSTGDELGEVRDEIVAAALEELGGEVGGPVGSVGFERVGEDGVGRGVAEGAEEGFAYGFEVGGYGVVGEGIENPAFGSHGCAFDDLSSVAGDEEESGAGVGGGGDEAGGFGIDDDGRGGIPGDGSLWRRRFVDVTNECDGEDGVAVGELGLGEFSAVCGEGECDDDEAGRGLGEGGGGSAVGPSAAESDVDAEAELAAFGLGVADVIEHVEADEGLVDEIFGGVIEHLGVSAGARGGSRAFQQRYRTTTSGPWGGRQLTTVGTVALKCLSEMMKISMLSV